VVSSVVAPLMIVSLTVLPETLGAEAYDRVLNELPAAISLAMVLPKASKVWLRCTAAYASVT
jgi:hypothetical protein